MHKLIIQSCMRGSSLASVFIPGKALCKLYKDFYIKIFLYQGIFWIKMTFLKYVKILFPFSFTKCQSATVYMCTFGNFRWEFSYCLASSFFLRIKNRMTLKKWLSAKAGCRWASFRWNSWYDEFRLLVCTLSKCSKIACIPPQKNC